MVKWKVSTLTGLSVTSRLLFHKLCSKIVEVPKLGHRSSCQGYQLDTKEISHFTSFTPSPLVTSPITN
jgi:hypothetical protein